MGQDEGKLYMIVPMKEINSPEKAVSPFDTLNRLREEHAVRFDSDRNCWDIFRYENVHDVLKNASAFSSRRAISEKENLLITDPPRHTQLRSLVNQAFTPKAIAALEPHIGDIANDLIASSTAGRMDMVRDFAGPLPVIVIAELLGVPASDRMLFKEWSDSTVKGPSENTEQAFQAVTAERKQAAERLTAYFVDIIKERKAQRKDDLVSLLLDAEIEGQKLDDQDLLGFCILLLVAGNETTTNLITNAVRLLTEQPDLQQVLKNDPASIPSAVEEVLRYYPPIQAIGRIAAEDTELGGQHIKAGSQIVNWVAAANRDGRKFDRPDAFVIGRKPNPHLSFGFGIHFCLGAPLARLEAKIALNLLLGRFDRISRSGHEQLQPIQSPFVFGVQSFPVKFD